MSGYIYSYQSTGPAWGGCFCRDRDTPYSRGGRSSVFEVCDVVPCISLAGYEKVETVYGTGNCLDLPIALSEIFSYFPLIFEMVQNDDFCAL